MKYSITYHKRVVRFLNKHPHLQKQFLKNTDIMEQDPFHRSLDIVHLEGVYRRLRVGGYRFIYTLNNNKLLIFFIDADTRGDSYKKRSQTLRA